MFLLRAPAGKSWAHWSPCLTYQGHGIRCGGHDLSHKQHEDRQREQDSYSWNKNVRNSLVITDSKAEITPHRSSRQLLQKHYVGCWGYTMSPIVSVHMGVCIFRGTLSVTCQNPKDPWMETSLVATTLRGSTSMVDSQGPDCINTKRQFYTAGSGNHVARRLVFIQVLTLQLNWLCDLE